MPRSEDIHASARPAPRGKDIMDDFLNRIGRVALLTPEQERNLGRDVQDGLKARQELEASESLDTASRLRLKRRIAKGEQARLQFIEANLRLVVSIARNYRTQSVDLADLVQEGNVGLLRAVERFNPDFQVRFSTYATYWIRQAVRHGMSRLGHAIALPDEKRALLAEVRRIEERLTQVLGRTPHEDEVAAEMGLTIDALHQLRRAELRVVSANAPIGDDGSTELFEVLADTEEPGVQAVDRSSLGEALDDAMQHLNQRDREILRLRFGFETGEVEPLETVAKRYGITRERVRQLEMHAVAKLRAGDENSALLDAVRGY